MPEHAYELAQHRFVPAVTAPEEARQRADNLWFLTRGRDLLVAVNGSAAAIPRATAPSDLGVATDDAHYLGALGGQHCFAAAVADGVTLPPEMEFANLRTLHGRLGEDPFWVAGRALQIVEWDRTHRYCGVCGAATVGDERERVKACPRCGHTAYPRLTPAVIFAVVRDDRILLARSHRHPPGLFSVLAGFVEPGETLEACVAREAKEEVGLDVTDIRYFGSQPWPFPHSLMIAFTCVYAGGEIRLEEEEMAEAAWYTADDLPRIPPSFTISRRLINWFVAQQ